MTILDEKGKLFGWINIIDLGVLLLVLLLIVMSVRFVTNKKTAVQGKDYYLVKVRATSLGPEVADTIKKGLDIYTPEGAYFGFVTINPEVGPTQVYITSPQGMLVPRAQPKMMDATFTFVCSVPQGSSEIKYGNQSFKAGAKGFIESHFTKYTIFVLSIQPLSHDEVNEIKAEVMETIPSESDENVVEDPTTKQTSESNP